MFDNKNLKCNNGTESCPDRCQAKHLTETSPTMACCRHSVGGLLNTITRASKRSVENVSRNYSGKTGKVGERDYRKVNSGVTRRIRPRPPPETAAA